MKLLLNLKIENLKKEICYEGQKIIVVILVF